MENIVHFIFKMLKGDKIKDEQFEKLLNARDDLLERSTSQISLCPPHTTKNLKPFFPFNFLLSKLQLASNLSNLNLCR
jgi:hypothetical protein